ncbi:ABC transporter G family member 3-like [Aegilops tauschii subsp. strangulata]|uniref:ABC transporter G family member 3-like n=1 Tax=Aegilops tauschii subsp. strangulata TaxID=200361 RepID=UPI003CC85748
MDEEDAVGISRSCPDLSSCREMKCPAAAIIGSPTSFADGPLRQREDEGKERRAQESSTVAFPPCSQIGATRGSKINSLDPGEDDQGDFSSVSMDTAVAIRTLEATYKSSAEAAAVESMIAKLIDKVRISAIFVFVSFLVLLSVCEVPAHIDEIKIYSHEDSNRHYGTLVFLLGHFLSSVSFLFLVSISSSLVFYSLIGLRNEFSFLMYFIITIFMCLLANEALMMIVAYIWLETYKCILTLICLYGLVQNEYVSTSFAVGATRTIPGVQAVRGLYGISSSTGAKWMNLLVLFLMAIGYWVVLYVLLRLDVRRHVRLGRCSCWPSIHTIAAPK